MVSGGIIFTATSRWDILSTVNFPDFIYTRNMSYKINKTNMLAKNIICTGSSTRFIDLKILSEPRNCLNMLQKNYQELLLQYLLLIH